MKGRALLFLLLALALASGCRLLGLTAVACDADANCADGFRCVDDVCVAEGEGEGEEGEGEEGEGEEGEGEEGEGEEGEGEEGEGEEGEGEGEGEGEVPFAVVNDVGFVLVVDDDLPADSPVYAASRAPGGCIERIDGAPVDVHCVGVDEAIVGVVLVDDDFFFYVDGPTDGVFRKSRTAAAADAALTIEANLNIGAQAVRGSTLLAARDGRVAYLVGSTVHVASVATGAVVVVHNTGVAGALGAVSVSDIFVGVAAQHTDDVVRIGIFDVGDVNANPSFEYSAFQNRGSGLPVATGYAGAAIARETFWSTRDETGGGGIFGFDDDEILFEGFPAAESRTLAALADPENLRTFAAAFAVDGVALYYVTDGVVGGGNTYGLFRLVTSLDPAAAPTRLADLPAAGASVAVDFLAGKAYVAVPSANGVFAYDL